MRERKSKFLGCSAGLVLALFAAGSTRAEAPPSCAKPVTKASLPSPVDSAASGSIDGIIYVAGGYNTHLASGSNALSTLYGYDPTTNKWTKMASMPGPRYAGNGAGVINGQLYVAGGWTQSPPLPNNNLFVYNPPTNTWTSKANMPHLSACGASGVLRGKLYVTTPCNGYSGYYTLLDVYDPVANTWTSLPGSHSAHANPAFGVINDKLYVAGGLNNSGAVTNVVEVFDPIANSWTELASMPTAVQSPESIVAGGWLTVMGGVTQSGQMPAIVQHYDFHTNKWTVESVSTHAEIRSGAMQSAYGVGFTIGGNNGQTISSNYESVCTPSIP